MAEYIWNNGRTGGGGGGSPYYLDPVNSVGDLPATAPEGSLILVKDIDALYERRSAAWVLFIDPSQVAADIATVQADVDAHEARTDNPHSVTKTQVGLGNVDNTSDADKPVSTAQAAAIAVVQADIDAHEADTSGVHGSTSSRTASSLVERDANGGTQFEYIDFNPAGASPAHQTGRLFYRAADHTLCYYNDEADVALNIGQEQWIRVRNNSGSTITNGQVVYVTGTTGQVPTIGLADADSITTARTVGIATHDIENNSFGYVTTFGLVRDVNTSAFTDGALLYLSSTAGALTATPPSAPSYAIPVAIVIYAHATQGILLADPSKMPGLGLGTANQVLGVNSGATGPEYKTIQGTTDEIIVTHGAGTITIDADATSAGTANKLVKRDSSGGSAFDYVDHDAQASAPTYTKGRVWYDDVDQTLRYYNDSTGDSVNIGQELNVKVRNTTGSTITAGQVVRIVGAVSGVPTVALAQSNAFATSKVYAVVTESIANNTNGYATIAGLIKNLNLSAFSDGDVLWLSSSVNGGLQNTRPASPNYVVPIGTVASNSATTGRLIVQMGLTRPLGFGSGNTVLGMNSGGTEQEYKFLTGQGNQINVNNTGNTVVIGKQGHRFSNYINNSSASFAITGWNAVSDLTVARSTTASELPRENTTASGIKITANSGTQSTADYVYYDFTLDDVDLNKKLSIEWAQKVIGAYSAGQLAVVITTQADRTTAVATPQTTAIPAADGVFQTTFDSGSTATLSLVIRATTDMATDTGICISDVVVGPGQIVQGAAIGEWESWTPTGNWVSNATYTGKKRRVGSNMQYTVNIFLSGAPATGDMYINLPAEDVIDTAAIPSATSFATVFGEARAYDNSVAAYLGAVTYRNTTTVYVATNSTSNLGLVTNLIPFTWGSGDTLAMEFTVPIARLAGNGTLNMGPGAQEEYLSNSGTWNSTDTTSFAYGPNGQAMAGTLGGTMTKRVRAQYPWQQGDIPILEFSTDRVVWTPAAASRVGGVYVIQGVDASGTNLCGAWMERVSGSSTDLDVFFGRYASIANDDAPTVDWPSSNAYWRVRKVKASSPVGFGLAAEGVSGLVSSESSNTFTATLTGFTAGTTGTARYSRVGKLVTLYIGTMTGTSNATTMTLTGLPAAITPQRNQVMTCLVIDSGNTGLGRATIANTGVITFDRFAAINNITSFTASGGKGTPEQVITYSLD